MSQDIVMKCLAHRFYHSLSYILSSLVLVTVATPSPAQSASPPRIPGHFQTVAKHHVVLGPVKPAVHKSQRQRKLVKS